MALLADILSRTSLMDWVLLVVVCIILFYIAGTWNYDFFSKRGLPYLKPKLPFLGNNITIFLRMQTFVGFVKEVYDAGKGFDVCGFFELYRPFYLVRDPELIKVITVKSFDHFMNHRGPLVETDNVFTQNLLFLKDQKWKNMRTLLSPAFTTSKIKAMFPMISECGDQMVQHLRQKFDDSKQSTGGKPIATDMKEIFSRLANDVIATIAFGVQCDSLKDPENEFFKMGKNLTTFTPLQTIIVLLTFLLPKIAKITGNDVMNPKAIAYFENIIYQTMKEREEKGIFRPDVLQMMIQAKKGELKAEAGDEHEIEKIGEGKSILTDKDIAAQMLIFFFGGFETVSTALCFTAHELAMNPDVQQRLREDVDETLAKEGGKTSYETVQSMNYLDMVLNESLRLNPPVLATDRQCSENINILSSGLTPALSFKKGDFISIPTIAIHHDPEYWHDPLTFNPERFNEENKKNIKPFTYLPFGFGPRLCIAQRFALLEVKIALVHLVKNFLLLPSQKAHYPTEYDKGFNNSIKGGFWCDLIPREEVFTPK